MQEARPPGYARLSDCPGLSGFGHDWSRFTPIDGLTLASRPVAIGRLVLRSAIATMLDSSVMELTYRLTRDDYRQCLALTTRRVMGQVKVPLGPVFLLLSLLATMGVLIWATAN